MSNSTRSTVQGVTNPSSCRYNSTLSIARPPHRPCAKAYYLPTKMSEEPEFARTVLSTHSGPRKYRRLNGAARWTTALPSATDLRGDPGRRDLTRLLC